MFRMTRLASAMAAASLTTIPAYAQTSNELEPVIVTATRTAFVDTDAPYASETYLRDEIQRSKASNLYEFLSKHTSVLISPDSGNPHAQKIDFRGYGLDGGFENIVITVNGRRLNNIDTMPQYLSSIDIHSVEKIEINKGIGGVRFGDGATAGAIQITINKEAINKATMAIGSDGYRTSSISAGVLNNRLTLSAYGFHTSTDGHSVADSSGNTDHSRNNSGNISLTANPTENIEVRASANKDDLDARYPSFLTLDQFNSDPSQSARNYSHWRHETEQVSAGASLFIGDYEISLDTSSEDKISEFIGSTDPSNYDYKSNKIELIKTIPIGEVIIGFDTFDGSRTTESDRTTKKNQGLYASLNGKLDEYSFTLGTRTEDVEYESVVLSNGSTSNSKHSLNAFEAGINRKINETLTVYGNYSDSFLTADIDRLFVSVYGNAPPWPLISRTFAGYIKPMESKTLSIGATLRDKGNTYKINAYRANLKNEFFLCKSPTISSCSSFGTNKNIDKSHKYGIELSAENKITESLSSSINYAWTQAIVDSAENGEITDKFLPTVSPHTLNANLDFKLDSQSQVGLAFNWRSTAYASDDFKNQFSQKQKHYQSVDASYSRTVDNFDYFVHVENLLGAENGQWIKDDAIYPSEFTRNLKVGLNITF